MAKRRRPRRRRPIPSAAVRRARSPRIPTAVELYFLRVLQNRADDFARIVRKRVTSRLIARCGVKDERHDAEEEDEDGAEAARAIAMLREEVVRDLESGELPTLADIAAKRTVKFSQQEFDRLGIKLLDGEPDLGPLIDKWRRGCVDRITSVEDDQLDKIEALLKNGDGLRVETLQDEIERQIDDVTTSRAELIARDQVLKLNAKITQHRQKAAGIEQYVWTTSNDERVRDTHLELEGETFPWDDPPVVNDDGDTGHPGDDFQCRCVAFPVLPELADDEGDDEPAADDEPKDDE